MNDKILEKVQRLFEYAKNSIIRDKWFKNNNICKLYYEGDQWHDKELNKQMDNIKATRYTFNQIERMVNLYTSLQIRSGKRSGFGVKDYVKDENSIVQQLKEYAYLIQTESDYNYYSSLKFTDMLIGGIGWSEYSKENGQLRYRHIPCEQMFFDPDDLSLKLDNSSFVARVSYRPLHYLLDKYPSKASYFKFLIDDYSDVSSDDFNNYDYLDDYWSNGRMIKIVEVQYKKLEKCYKVILRNKNREFMEDYITRSFLTFSLTDVQNNIEDIEYEYDLEIEEIKATRIYKAVYSDYVLLEHGPLNEQVPNQKEFSYIPVMLRRDTEYVPYGVVNTFISLQDARNYIWSTILHYSDAKTLIVNLENNNLADTAQLERIIRTELQVKNGIVFSNSGRDYQVIDHNGAMQQRFVLLDNNIREFENLSGLYNTELSGNEDRNLSGVAINMRSINTMNAQNHILLAYNSMLISEGKSLLNSIQGLENLNLKVMYEREGKKVNAILSFIYRTLSFDVFPDTTSNFSSSSEEDKIRFNEIINSPKAALLLSSPLYLEQLGFSTNKAFELVEEFKRLNQEQNQEQTQENVDVNNVNQETVN